jgi:hypothetical protein
LEHGPARGGRSINTLLVEEQIDALFVQALQDAKQIRQ